MVLSFALRMGLDMFAIYLGNWVLSKRMSGTDPWMDDFVTLYPCIDRG